MNERFKILLKYRFLLAAAIVLMLFSNSYAAGGQAEFKHITRVGTLRKFLK